MVTEKQPIFVLAWVTTEDKSKHILGEGGSVVFVEHPERGWEIPGGHLEKGETPEQALLRELKEETGLEGVIQKWNKTYYPKGWVAHVHVQVPKNEKWSVDDAKVQMVKWWNEIPPLIEWTHEEFCDLTQWCSSID